MVKGFMTGTFDIIHRGHIEIFRYGKSLCDEFVVAVDTDDRVKSKKGESRPFNSLEDRMEVLRSISYIDKVIPFATDSELEHIVRTECPKWWLMGSDWKDAKRPEVTLLCKNIFFDRVGDHSTTRILERESS